MPARFARRLVLLALVGGIAADVLFDRVGLGINVPLFVSAILLAALALPILAVSPGLLPSADVVFGRAVAKTLNLPIDAADLATRATLSLAAAWLLGGVFALAAAAVPVSAEPPGIDEVVAAARSTGIRLSVATEATVVLIAVDLLFAIFVGVQLGYLFGCAD